MFEELGVLYRGLVLGLMIAAPVGPIGLLCIRRTVQSGMIIGFCTGFGAAFADALFAGIAAFGVAQITDWIRAYNDMIHLVGGVFLLVVAWHTWFDPPRQPKLEPESGRIEALKALGSSFGLTLTNPITLFATMAVVATFGELHNKWDALTLVAGIFSGSAMWWLLLSSGVALVRHRFTESRVQWINRITAVGLVALGGWALVGGMMGLLNLPQMHLG